MVSTSSLARDAATASLTVGHGETALQSPPAARWSTWKVAAPAAEGANARSAETMSAARRGFTAQH